MPHASWMETTWMLVAFVGWIIKVILTASSYYEYRDAKSGAKPVRVFMSHGMLMHMAHMLAVFTLVLTAAVFSVLNQPPPPPIHTTQSFGLVLFWIAVSSLLTMHAIFFARWWHAMSEGDYNGGEDHEGPVISLPAKIQTTITKGKKIQSHVIEEGEDEVPKGEKK